MTTLRALAERVAQGGVLHTDDAALIGASHDLIAIGMMADDVRRRLHGTDTTFLRVFEIHADAVPAALPSGISAGEFRIVGRPDSIESACAAVASARRLAGGLPLTGFSLPDLEVLLGTAPDTFSRLKSGGLDGIAAVPLDGMTSTAAVVAARQAGLLVARLTVDSPAADPIALLTHGREFAAAAGSFRVFAPLPRHLSVSAPTTGYDDVKTIALARLLVREIPSIQVDWALYGPKLAQVGLTVGADDVDAVAAVEIVGLGARRSAIEEIRGNIRAAGFQPVERDGRFQVSGGPVPGLDGPRG